MFVPSFICIQSLFRQDYSLDDLALPVGPCISESYIEIKSKLNFYFQTSLWCLTSFIKAFKTFIKPFEAPQRSLKIKI